MVILMIFSAQVDGDFVSLSKDRRNCCILFKFGMLVYFGGSPGRLMLYEKLPYWIYILNEMANLTWTIYPIFFIPDSVVWKGPPIVRYALIIS